MRFISENIFGTIDPYAPYFLLSGVLLLLVRRSAEEKRERANHHTRYRTAITERTRSNRQKPRE